MKFGDKLILLRKKKGMNQEELAEKLGVSRQSVSKWESNNSYPETDKIVQICNIFNCSMDDLINDSITNIEEIQRKDRNNLNIAIDSFLEFITKSINMFSSMKFINGLKCIIEMIILTFILALVGNTISGIISHSVANIFVFTNANMIIESILKSILLVIWIIIEIIIIVHTFKIRYLDYYDKIHLEKTSDSTENDNNKISLDKKEKIIIRDKNDRPFAFLSVLSSIIIIFAKIILLLISINFIMILISLSIALVISIFLTPNSILFLGADISLLSVIIINAIILILIMSFVFNKKIKFKKLLLIFLCAVIFTGVGIGISSISFKNLKIDDKVEYTKTSKELIDYKDNLVVVPGGLIDTEYEIDNTLDNIKVTIYYNDYIANYNIKTDDNYYGVNTYEVHSVDKALSPKDMYNMFIPDLKKNIIKTNHYAFKIKVTSNEEIINKLIDNASKVYVFEKEETQNGYYIKNVNHKINENDNCSEINDYNAVTGEITTSGNCKCNVKEEGNYLNFNCNYEE